MACHIKYDAQSGFIRQIMDISPAEADLYAEPGWQVMAVAVPPTLAADYVLAGTVTPRPVLPDFDKTAILADGIDTATLSGLPDPCTVTVNGQDHSVTGGVLELDADHPGTYRVEIRHFPYRDFVQEITAA
ncbi:MAG: hypothetical protein RLY86_3813 [Pseudomonadota bacterium]|jgi:hypothetical protein